MQPLRIDYDQRTFATFSGTALNSGITTSRFFEGKVPLKFWREGRVIELPAGSYGELGIYKELGGAVLASATEWEQSGVGEDTEYLFYLNLNSVGIEGDGGSQPSLFAPVNGVEPASLKLILEVVWHPPGERRTSSSMPLTVNNVYTRGPIASPQPAAPEYPPVAAILRKDDNLAGIPDPTAALMNLGADSRYWKRSEADQVGGPLTLVDGGDGTPAIPPSLLQELSLIADAGDLGDA